MKKMILAAPIGFVIFLLILFNRKLYSGVYLQYDLYSYELILTFLLITFSLSIFFQGWFLSKKGNQKFIVLSGMFFLIALLDFTRIFMFESNWIRSNATNLTGAWLMIISLCSGSIALLSIIVLSNWRLTDKSRKFLQFGLVLLSISSIVYLVNWGNHLPAFFQDTNNHSTIVKGLFIGSAITLIYVLIETWKKQNSNHENLFIFITAAYFLFSQTIFMFSPGRSSTELLFSLLFKVVGEAFLIVWMFKQIIEEIDFVYKQSEKQLYQVKYFDSLTGLPNREYIISKIEECMPFQQSAMVILVNFDRFSRINDVLGQKVGDQFLVSAAKTLEGIKETNWELGRITADEFAFIVKNANSRLAILRVVHKILKEAYTTLKLADYEFRLGVRLGIVLINKDEKNADEVLTNAKLAMNSIKDKEKRYEFYSEKINKEALESLMIENDLVKAISDNELVLHYQPQVDIEKGIVTGVEALVRWNHPQLGMLPPYKFISIAEQTGSIEQLGKWVIKEACRQLKIWNSKGVTDLNMSVNLSVRQLLHSQFFNELKHAIDESQIDPSKLTLELTESMTMEYTIIEPILTRIKNLGIKIAIDDFGTGYSSLSYLTRLPFDYLKIDRMFIQDLLNDKNSLTIVETIIAMANQLGAVTIAEGVETKQQCELLREKKCNNIQGYLISKPIAPNEFYEQYVNNKLISTAM